MSAFKRKPILSNYPVRKAKTDLYQIHIFKNRPCLLYHIVSFLSPCLPSPVPTPMDLAVDDLKAHLKTLQTCLATCLDLFIREFSLVADDRIPVNFLNGLKDFEKLVCWRAILLCYAVTKGQQTPQEMQLWAVFADFHGLNSLISAGTGSGKMLPTALKILLDNPADHLITITLSPLKCLQATQQNDFNSCYRIFTVVINEDTPRHEAWWDVSQFRIFLIHGHNSCQKHVFNLKTQMPRLTRHLIVTVEQLFKSQEGHLPRLGILLHNSHFQHQVICIIRGAHRSRFWSIFDPFLIHFSFVFVDIDHQK